MLLSIINDNFGGFIVCLSLWITCFELENIRNKACFIIQFHRFVFLWKIIVYNFLTLFCETLCVIFCDGYTPMDHLEDQTVISNRHQEHQDLWQQHQYTGTGQLLLSPRFAPVCHGNNFLHFLFKTNIKNPVSLVNFETLKIHVKEIPGVL